MNNYLATCKMKMAKHSPEILFGIGVVGTVTSVVLACKATTKLDDILVPTKTSIETIHKAAKGELTLAAPYSKEDEKKDLTIVYSKAAYQLSKLYMPSILVGAVSIGCMGKSNSILRNRGAAVAAAYATLDKGFEEYRKRVIDKFGNEIDSELKYGIKATQVEETVVDENGKKKKVKKNVSVIDNGELSDYAIYFDKTTSPNYEDNDDYNMFFLGAQQQYATDLLRAKKYLTLNEVLDSLGIVASDERIQRIRKAGMVVGWIFEKDNKVGDNCVLFNIIHTSRRNADGELEPCIVIDFNVDGNIYDRM